MLLFITAVAVVLVVSFLCSICESVLLSLTRPQVEVLTRQGRRAGQLLSEFKTNIDVPIAAILILNTAAHTIGAAVAGASYSSVFDPATLWIFSLLFTLAVLLFTEIIPKTLGVSYATVLAAPVAHGINLLVWLLRPLVLLSERISRSLRGDREVPVTSAEEIRLLAVLGRSEGVVGERTAGMIVGATQLRELRAQDIMLPREQVRFFTGGMGRREALALVRETRHSRFPFTPTEDLDDVSGVVLAKQLLDWLLQHDGERIDWPVLTRDALVVPESAPLPQLLRTFQDSHRHLAVIVDEYGTVEGIATLEDVLEEIVGDIRDESDQPADDFVEEPDGSLRVRGTVDLRRLAARLDIPWKPQADVTSVGGLITETLERIPKVGDAIDWHGYRLSVLRADRRRVRLVRVSRAEDNPS
ncbi:MAG: HlyC/CorC family transporter [Gammaproteobacteria bacterium]|nr:MAG: HlyC/CorC family transporter [Gammaproteobacteria bacterium]